jgi:hypothetical protein
LLHILLDPLASLDNTVVDVSKLIPDLVENGTAMRILVMYGYLFGSRGPVGGICWVTKLLGHVL